jgi:geranylgeranyl pyrophosphate synthase
LIASIEIPTKIQEGIDLVEQNMLAQVDNYSPALQAEVKLLISSGGKRIRPLVILLVNRMLNGAGNQIVNLATAIELLHTATLVHDDLIDGSLLRRGIPTMNSKWSSAATVLTGDFLFSCAATTAARTGNLEVIELFSATLTTIVNGEINQMFFSRCNPSRDDYFNRIYAKTASLFETSAKSAAILCGVDRKQIELLKKFGYDLGMAFQIVDDVLDYTGDQVKFGKPVGGDLRQGLITMPMHFYMEENPTDKAVQTILSGKCLNDEEEIDRVIKAVTGGTAIQRSFDEAKKFVDQAKDSLLQFNDCLERKLLLDLASYSIDRNV